jgi:hypothetical protein
MYRVWIEYKNSSKKEENVPDADTAKTLKSEWESQGEWKAAGYALINQS